MAAILSDQLIDLKMAGKSRSRCHHISWGKTVGILALLTVLIIPVSGEETVEKEDRSNSVFRVFQFPVVDLNNVDEIKSGKQTETGLVTGTGMALAALALWVVVTLAYLASASFAPNKVDNSRIQAQERDEYLSNIVASIATLTSANSVDDPPKKESKSKLKPQTSWIDRNGIGDHKVHSTEGHRVHTSHAGQNTRLPLVSHSRVDPDAVDENLTDLVAGGVTGLVTMTEGAQLVSNLASGAAGLLSGGIERVGNVVTDSSVQDCVLQTVCYLTAPENDLYPTRSLKSRRRSSFRRRKRRKQNKNKNVIKLEDLVFDSFGSKDKEDDDYDDYDYSDYYEDDLHGSDQLSPKDCEVFGCGVVTVGHALVSLYRRVDIIRQLVQQ